MKRRRGRSWKKWAILSLDGRNVVTLLQLPKYLSTSPCDSSGIKMKTLEWLESHIFFKTGFHINLCTQNFSCYAKANAVRITYTALSVNRVWENADVCSEKHTKNIRHAVLKICKVFKCYRRKYMALLLAFRQLEVHVDNRLLSCTRCLNAGNCVQDTRMYLSTYFCSF